MGELERARRLIALNHVNANGDAEMRDLVDALLLDRAATLNENKSLHSETALLHHDVIDAYRTGLSPGARRVVGWGVVALIAVSAVTGLTLWFGGVVPVTHAVRRSLGVEAAPVRAGPSWAGPVFSFTAVGPPEIIKAVMNRFKVMPTEIDTGIGRRVSLRYVDGPYSRLEGEAQRAQALAIARFVWGLPLRPKGTDTITVRVERPMRVIGDVGVSTEQIFMPAELNGR